MRLSLCLEMVFDGRPLVERLRTAARLGYDSVEFWDWRNKDRAALKAAADDHGVGIAAFSGNRQWTMTNPEDRAAFLDEVKQSLDVAVELRCGHLMLLADRLLGDGSAAPSPAGLTDGDKTASIAEALAAAAELAAGSGVVLALEPLNTKLDHPRYFLDRSAPGFEIVRRVGSPHARLLYDAYHMSMMGEDAAAEVGTNLSLVGYIHVADMPGRHEPGSGSIDYRRFAATLRRMGYQGTVGMEFSPSGSSEAAAKAALEYFRAE